MNSKILGLTAALLILAFFSVASAYCGIIPYSLIENDKKADDRARPELLRKKHSEILKKLSDLKKKKAVISRISRR